jgi:hypothetical protein
VLTSTQSQLNIGQLRAGIYTVTIQTNTGIAIERLVIE